MWGGLPIGHPRLGDDPMVTFDTTIVHAFHRDHSYNSSALEDAEKLKYDKYSDPYARVCGLAFVPLASTSIGQLGADLLRVLWVRAIIAVGRAEVEGADGEVLVAAHGPRPDVLASKMRRGLLFQAMKNWYLIGTYEAVVHRILAAMWHAQGPQVGPVPAGPSRAQRSSACGPLPGPVPAPMGSGSSSALPGGLVMVDGGGPAARSVGRP